ncbi:MAG: FKBP-type peptidyl-prolyl cis-trans isomerase [Bacteroidales bacterium]|nr:FKBP-type peptidyl-prolyl cis-trans isomerase [Bacteroidales bacterium]
MKNLRKIQSVLLLAAGLLVLTSCTEETEDQDALEQEQRFFSIFMAANYPDAVRQPSGLYYIENKEGTGDMPGDSAWLLVNHVAYTIPDEVVYETYIENVAYDNFLGDDDALYGPYKIRNGLHNEGFTEGLTMMREGGEATFLFTSELGYGSKNAGSVGAYRSLKYEVILLEVLGDDIEEYEAAKIVAYTDTIPGVDTVYNAENDITMYYVVDEPTDGPPVAMDSTIAVAYRGYLTDGRVFDESPEDSYYQFKVGDYEAETSPIIGWHLGLERFKEGEKGRLIIPYKFAYGETGNYSSKGNVSIPPYETLVFEVEVISVDPDTDEEDPGQEQ